MKNAAHASLWTCAFNTKRRAWGYAARIYAGVVLAVIAVSLTRPFFVTVNPEIEVLKVQ